MPVYLLNLARNPVADAKLVNGSSFHNKRLTDDEQLLFFNIMLPIEPGVDEASMPEIYSDADGNETLDQLIDGTTIWWPKDRIIESLRLDIVNLLPMNKSIDVNYLAANHVKKRLTFGQGSNGGINHREDSCRNHIRRESTNFRLSERS